MKARFAQILKNYSVGHCEFVAVHGGAWTVYWVWFSLGLCSFKSLKDLCGLSFVRWDLDFSQIWKRSPQALLDFLVYFGGGRSDRTVPRFRLVGLEVMSDYLLSPWLNILFHFKVQCSFLWLWVWWVCKISLWASIVFTFLKCECSFFLLAGRWNHLMVCWLSLFFLPLSQKFSILRYVIAFLHHWGTCSTFSFLLCF